MLFNSQIFILCFLPLVWLGFDALRRRGGGELAWLLLASVCFYIWWEPADLPILLGSIAANFACGLWLAASTGRRRRILLALGVAGNLGLLAWFKYRALAITSLNGLGLELSVPELILPLAISFFTFQQIAYLVDVARGLAPERSPLRYAVFVSFFPQLIAGPIVHWTEMMPALDRVRSRDRVADLAVGLSVFSIGLAKKVWLADSLAPIADPLFAEAGSGMVPSSADAWLGVLAYTLQLYFDFSAYSDMALGIARMFGIDLPINFLSPYRAANLAEFWRRWHITLSRFLRDYLYVPLGGNRHGRWVTMRNLLLTMALGGLWHGAQWTFLAWGLWHGLGLVLLRLWHDHVMPAQRVRSGLLAALRSAAAVALTFLFVTFGWVLFRATDFASAARILEAMLSMPISLSAWSDARAEALAWVIGGLVLVFAAPNTAQIFASARLGLWPSGVTLGRGPAVLRFQPSLPWALLLGLMLAITVLGLSRETVFLYFQF